MSIWDDSVILGVQLGQEIGLFCFFWLLLKSEIVNIWGSVGLNSTTVD